MLFARPWAAWRRLQYGSVFSLLILGCLYWVYVSNFYVAPTCFDGAQNGEETGVDCGGSCQRVCMGDTRGAVVKWSRSFRITDGQYNAVGYVENTNPNIGIPQLEYTFSLFDAQGLIVERSGTTFLPPNGEYPIFEGPIFTNGRVPTRTFLELEPPLLWLTVPIGREQFSLVRRQLTNADISPRLDATLYNEELTATGEVEVVATIFDANGNALTASRTIVDDFLPRTEQDIVFTWPEPIAKTVRSCEVPTDVVVAIDLSGSMNNDQAEPPEPITSVLGAAQRFVGRLQERDQAALITFASEAVTNQGFSSPRFISGRIRELGIDPEEEQGSTNTGDAFLRAAQLFNSANKNPDARKVMVILTDGLATAPEEEPEQYARELATALKQTDVTVFAIGLGQEVNMEFVRDIASPNAAFQALSSSEVDSIYQAITGAICEDGAARIDIVPKTDANFPGLDQWLRDN
jgi:Mg-chelatase subunit ChlD